jgi:hypothetical protein
LTPYLSGTELFDSRNVFVIGNTHHGFAFAKLVRIEVNTPKVINEQSN